MRKWQIKRRSNIGQRLTEAYNTQTENWEKETSYGEPHFEAEVNKAKQMLSTLKVNMRMPIPIKWIRLYEIIG